MHDLASRAFALLLALAIFGCGSIPPPAERSPSGVVLVTIDTLRADRLALYGGPLATPAIEALARQGALFVNAFAQSPLTLPSHSSILTGTYPTFHGVRDNGRFTLPEEMETLAEILEDAGYDTAAFVGGFPVHSRFGLAQGFDLYDDDLPRAGLRLSLAERRAEEVVGPATDWLTERGDEPYFLWVHLFDPHAPYEPPPPFAEAFDDAYDGEIAYVDRVLGELFNAAGEDALVVVTSDHGEGLGDHGEATHSLFVYDSTMRVPLVVRGPGVPAATVVEEQVRSIDLVPTVLELLGRPGACESCQGASLAAGWRDGAGNGERRPSYGETYFPRLNLGWSELRSLRHEGWKYIEAPEPELYDLEADPGETRNLAGEHPERLRALAAALAEVERRTRREDATAATTADAETLSMLRSLGYVASREPSGGGEASRPDPKSRLHVWEAIRSGMALVAHGSWKEAVPAFESVIEEEPELLLARSYLAAAYFETGRYAEAADECAKVLAEEPGDAESALLLGRSHFRMGREADARAILARAANLDELSPEPWVELSQLHLAKGETAEARKALEEAAARDDEAPSVLLMKGKLAALAGDAASAESSFRRALAAAPAEEEARVQLGNLLLGARRLDEAEALYQEGLALRPETAAFHLGLGHGRALAGRMSEAIPRFEKALQLEPGSTMALNSLAFAHAEAGDAKRASELLSRSLSLDPRQPEIAALLERLRRAGRQ